MPAADTRSGRVDPVEADETYSLIERAIVFLRAHRDGRLKLADLAAHIGLSPSHTLRLFSRWAGISPKRFLQFLSVEHAKQRMGQTGDLLGLALNTGLSGPGRLHDLFVSMEAMSPGEFKRAAADVRVRCGFGDTPFGRALIAFTSRGICHLSFVEPRCRESAAAMLQAMWPAATLEPDPAGSSALLERIFARSPATADSGLSLWVSGTNFQIQVWRALLQIPYAGLLSYGQLAALLGRPNAARAVGSAVARNRVAFLIPCHRVLRGSGDFGVYHWGPERKMAMCAWEVATAGTGQAG